MTTTTFYPSVRRFPRRQGSVQTAPSYLRSIALAVLLLSVPALTAAAGVTVTEIDLAPRVRALSHESAVLKQEKTFCAVLPASYSKEGGPWPVLFLLHGRGRTERSLIDDPGARDALLAAPFVTILPDGDDGWYINSPAKPEDRYGDYLDEVVDLATRHFNLSTDPKQRGLSGWSMGGYGCTRYAIDHPGQFAALAPIIGLLDFPRTGLPEGQSYAVPTDRFGADESVWKTLNPINGAEALRGTALCLITGTTAFDRTMNENFAARLKVLDIPCTWHLLEGGHTFDVVREAVPTVVEFMTKALAET